jgi:hypothetical protein
MLVKKIEKKLRSLKNFTQRSFYYRLRQVISSDLITYSSVQLDKVSF